ncbi:Cu(I)-responsive transcriptional regulator [Marinimicrobium alkaliphilum]|uniref:Cu(I)-responsive transcriptional regulator n=1 Tax=Marinimicrobium alkaliphilum TaxID=2202654 RepID=UPI000DB97E14|nr:Cu(I)-responsive transcriptional regulator [Marinimicrobium alkaliphilum]
MKRRQPEPKLATAEAREQGLYNIGEAADASGVSAKMIRHYEQSGLIDPAKRTLSNYRVYNDRDIHQLRFIKQARDLGFSIKQIGQLLALWQDQGRRSAEVKQLAQTHITDIEARIQQLEAMKATLSDLIHRCKGNDRPDCPILASLANTGNR